jgi:hypothetical protein
MEGYVKVATLDNEIEALLLESVLEERGTPYVLRSYHDTAYDGLFQSQKGWGVVSAPRERREEILAIIEDLRKGREAESTEFPE